MAATTTPTTIPRAEQMSPRLTPAQIERVASIGHRRDVRAGEVLFDVGDQNTRFFVVVSGVLDIVRLIGDREEPLIVHREGQFTGEINMLSARRSLVRARMAGDGAVIAVDRDDLRTLVQRDSELSEILMRAFILRRVALMGLETNDMVLLGSRHSGNTQRIREFPLRSGCAEREARQQQAARKAQNKDLHGTNLMAFAVSTCRQ